MTRWSEEELREKVGQLFIVGFHGLTPSDDIKRLIQTHRVGAVILFSRNISTAQQLRELTGSLQTLGKEGGHKQGLIISIDQENGLVTRIKPPVTAQLPGAMALAATGDDQDARDVARATAVTLKSFGINMNYSPVADINSEPKNPVIGVRSFSDEPETVGRLVSVQVNAIREGRVASCVKHFPGHGETTVDSHHGLPILEKSKEELDMCELIPFRRAVVEGVPSIMTAHIAIPSIGDSNLPASLNPDVINILRKEMRYNGLVVSDCLEMDGVRATFGTEKSAVMALKAGTDCVMVCHTISAQIGAIEEVVTAVKTGILPQEIIQASVDRVEKLKREYVIGNSMTQPPTHEVTSMRNESQKELAANIYAKSTTVVRSVKEPFPVAPGPGKKTVFISIGQKSTGGGAIGSGELENGDHEPSTYIDILRLQRPNIVNINIPKDLDISGEYEKLVAEADMVILATHNASLNPSQKDFGLSLGRQLGKKMIVIATCDPYDFLEDTKDIQNYITTYEPTIPAFKAAVDIIFGLKSAQGRLPVGVPAKLHDIHVLTTSDDDVQRLWNMWEEIYPKWSIALSRLRKVLNVSHGKHYIHEGGFCISYLMAGPNGALHSKIAAIGVLASFRGKGVGTALLNAAKAGLRVSAGSQRLQSLEIGSVFPRLWPQVPTSFTPSEQEFFLRRSFRPTSAPTARDLYKSIASSIAPPETLARIAALNLNITFTPWTEVMYEECIRKQRRQFHNIGWVEAYERLHQANQHHEVMVGIDKETNEQVAWTLMCSQDAVVADDFAFLPRMPAGKKTGLIGCVGVDETWRGKGVGGALLVSAMEDMRRRGMEGVMIDWVVIRGFYEKLGFEPHWEYVGYVW